DDVRRLFRRTIAVGASFGVVEVLGPRHEGKPLKIQVATFRSDVSYSDGRHPDAVVFSGPREDALRRDFTINGMFKDPLTGDIIDYVGGQDDLRTKVLRAIGEPSQRFDEDKLRMLRAVRIGTRFDRRPVGTHTEGARSAWRGGIVSAGVRGLAARCRQAAHGRSHAGPLYVLLSRARRQAPGGRDLSAAASVERGARAH